MNLEQSIHKIAKEKLDYYRQWMFDEPIVVSYSHHEKLQRLQKLMYKAIVFFVENYKTYRHLQPISEKANQIIDIWSKRPYQVGTYRTDFVYDANQQEKIIEITCRFSLNGVYLSAIINMMAEHYRQTHHPYLVVLDVYSDIYQHLEACHKNVSGIYVLVGDDRRNESKLYTDIYEEMGLRVIPIHFSEIKKNFKKLEQAWVVVELSLEEIESLELEVIEELSKLNIINDLRTILLIHDKRFFAVLGNEQFLDAALTKEEQAFFKQFYIPTYRFDTASEEIWTKARQDKDKWILKHRSLGKSQQIYAGVVTEQATWETLFETGAIQEMVLQEWIPQQRMQGKVNGKPHSDYVTGTLLFFDDNYFGFGDFRTSSFPVTNKVDHRKMSSLILAEGSELLEQQFQNYIK